MNKHTEIPPLSQTSVSSSTSFETFRSIGSYEISNLIQKEPTSFNGDVRIKKYKVTIQEIIEPKEVYEKRIQELWDKCNNMHHYNPIKNIAKKLGYELKGSIDSKRIR
jgi:hypothetical protein